MAINPQLYADINAIRSNESSAKTVSLDDYKAYLRVQYAHHVHDVICYSFVNNSRQWHFRKQRYYARILNQFRGGLVEIVNWSWSPSSKIRKLRGHIKGIKRFLAANGVRIIELDEFRTSKMCCNCDGGVIKRVAYPPIRLKSPDAIRSPDMVIPRVSAVALVVKSEGKRDCSESNRLKSLRHFP